MKYDEVLKATKEILETTASDSVKIAAIQELWKSYRCYIS